MAFLPHLRALKITKYLIIILVYRIKDNKTISRLKSRKLLIVFRFGFTRIFPEFFFKGSMLLLLSKLLFFKNNSFGFVIFLTDFHLIINLFHKHDFWLSLFSVLFGGWLFQRLIRFSLDVDSSPSGLAHSIIVYMQQVNIPTVNIKKHQNQFFREDLKKGNGYKNRSTEGEGQTGEKKMFIARK